MDNDGKAEGCRGKGNAGFSVLPRNRHPAVGLLELPFELFLCRIIYLDDRNLNGGAAALCFDWSQPSVIKPAALRIDNEEQAGKVRVCEAIECSTLKRVVRPGRVLGGLNLDRERVDARSVVREADKKIISQDIGCRARDEHRFERREK